VGGRRIGAIRGRVQYRLPGGHYAKLDRKTGEILSVKADRTPYKNVVILREPPVLAMGQRAPARRESTRRVGYPLLHEPSWRARVHP